MSAKAHRYFKLRRLRLALFIVVGSTTLVGLAFSIVLPGATASVPPGFKKKVEAIRRRKAMLRDGGNAPNGDASGVNPNNETLGELDADFPDIVERGKPFKMDVVLLPKDDNFKGKVKVYMEQTNLVSYEPRVFFLEPHQRQTVRATITKTNSGLVGILATTEPRVWGEIEEVVTVGFTAKVKTNITDPVEGGVRKSFYQLALHKNSVNCPTCR
jgi:hypothetical protein